MDIGKIQTLTIARQAPPGFYLEDEEGNEVLLPNSFITSEMQEGNTLDVFVYTDSEDRLIATTQTPKITLGEFAVLEVTDRAPFGVFMDWGLMKDLLVPKNQQASHMEIGEKYPVYLYLDEQTDRLAGSNKVENFLDNEAVELKEREKVDLLVYKETEIGYKVIINKLHYGLLYKSDLLQPVAVGDAPTGYIKQIREDGKIDVTLQKPGYGHVEPNAQKILDLLQTGNGFLNLNDRSNPDDIRTQLQMSKKTFKKAIGLLYKQRVIRMENKGIRLV